MTTLRYTYRFYPAKEQAEQLAQSFGCARFVYNWGVAESKDILAQRALEKAQGHPPKQMVSLSYKELCHRLTLLKQKESTSWLQEVSSVTLQQSLKHVISAWKGCFAKRTGQPRFKAKHFAKKSLTYASNAFSIKEGKVYLAKQKQPLHIKWSRPLPGMPQTLPSSCTITQDACGRYHIIFVVQKEEATLAPIAHTIGLDLGLGHFAIDSDGVKYENPKFLAKDLKKLGKAQRALARKQKGSVRGAKQKLKVAKIYARIGDKRNDFTHKLSTKLVHENQGIGVESLCVKSMVKTRRFSRAISDAGWGGFVQKLESKANRWGRRVVKIDRFFPSSKTCSDCQHVAKEMPLNLRDWTCEHCGSTHDRDINAALNIKRVAGLADLSKHARGEETAGSLHLAVG